MASRLPGIYFETVVPPVPEPLPRMDIAAFVGFAASGPLNVPVAIEDAGRFQEIFGEDQVLGWDAGRGELAYAQMPPAVRAFLRNNGRRCWAVRIAGDAATSNKFLVPGLLRSFEGIPYQGAWVDARSEGSWSDEWSVNAKLSFRPIAAEAPQRTGSPPDGISLVLHTEPANLMAPGDVVQMVFDSGPGGSQVVAFLPVASLSSQLVKTPLGAVQQVTTVAGSLGYWFRTAVDAEFTLSSPSHVYRLTPPEDVELAVAGFEIRLGNDGPALVVEVPREQAKEITPGSWLRLAFVPVQLPAGAQELLAVVDTICGSSGTAPNPASPSAEGELFQLVCNASWWVLTPDAGWAAASGLPRTGVVTLELWARDGSGRVSTLYGLGFTTQHARYLGYLPTDALLYGKAPCAIEPPGADVRKAADDPRFAMAAPPEDLPSSRGLPLYLPLGVTGVVYPHYYQPALPQTATELQRDGLELDGRIAYSDLFLDPDLAGATVDTLLSQAFHKQNELPSRDGNGIGEPLEKLHAVLSLDEVSMIAVPDAAQPGWRKEPRVADTLGAPELLSVDAAQPGGDVNATWTVVEGATSYTLQQSADPQFATATVAGEGTATAILVAQRAGCPQTVYFRVRANKGAIAGPFSNTLSRVLPLQAFTGCEARDIAPPVLAVDPVLSRGRAVLKWTTPAGGADAFQVQTAFDPAFVLPEVIYRGSDPYLEVWRDPSRTVYFRVSASRGSTAGPWSNTVAVASSGSYSRYEMNRPGALTAKQFGLELPKIHQAMLRLSAARGDMVALLSLPRNFSADDAALYKTQLTAALASEDGPRTLSFGAIYHPWLVVRDSSDDRPGAIRSVVPDGGIAGSFAERTLATGAWISPANQPLAGAVDMDVHADNLPALTFFDNQLNLVLPEPSGFLSMSSFTLSTAPKLVEMNVRRLLILLRRLAVRDGQEYVFEPNADGLWRTVRRHFEDVLGDMFIRGAFAGATPDESFRVRTDISAGSQQAIDNGIFVVELQVAPSYPMEFLTVRLVQTGGELQLSEEL